MLKIKSVTVELVALNLAVLKSLLSQPGLRLRKSKNSEAWMIIKMAANEQSFEIVLYTQSHSKEELINAVSEVLKGSTKWRVMMAGRSETKVPTLVCQDETTMEDLAAAIAALKKS